MFGNDDPTPRKKVLIADDDRAIVKALSARLDAEGYDVVTAHDGLTAIQKARRDNPDVILIDVSMPAGTGTYVTKVLKEDPETMMIPIIIMTAKESDEHFDAAMENGACGFLKKPFEDGVLMPLIESAEPIAPVVNTGLVSWDITIQR